MLILKVHVTLQLYSIQKLHKEDFPIIPVVLYVTTVANTIAKFVLDIIKLCCVFIVEYSINIWYNLGERFQKLNVPHNIEFVSHGVKNLDPSIRPCYVNHY